MYVVGWCSGSLVNWWTNATMQAFQNRTYCIEQQYSHYEVLPGLYINGKLTLGENIADNGGLKEAFYAYKRAMASDPSAASSLQLIQSYFSGLTSDQLFFVAYAQNWCSQYTEPYLYWLVNTNPHSPGKFRVNGPVSNFDEFASTFSCKSNTTMNPGVKCTVW